MVKVAINGYGRIGRLAARIIILKHLNEMELAAINTSGSMDIKGWGHLTNYDTIYGRFEKPLTWKEIKPAKQATDEDPVIGHFMVEGKKIPVTAQRDPEKLPWREYGIDVVIESTGVFRTEEDAKKHAKAGAKKIIISAPAKGGNVGTYVMSVKDVKENEDVDVISNASCTTNCVAPVAAVMHSRFGIEKAMMTTVHSYTDSQNLVDNSHKDLRRARAAAENIIPTSTGAAIATTETIPELKGIFDGKALRVPTATGSITDFTLLLKKDVTVEQVNQAFIDASEDPLYKGILAVTDEPLVSHDIIGRSESSIVDLEMTQVVGGNMVKIFAWYDNEWGYANRLVEQVMRVSRTIDSDKAPSDPLTLTHQSE